MCDKVLKVFNPSWVVWSYIFWSIANFNHLTNSFGMIWECKPTFFLNSMTKLDDILTSRGMSVFYVFKSHVLSSPCPEKGGLLRTDQKLWMTHVLWKPSWTFTSRLWWFSICVGTKQGLVTNVHSELSGPRWICRQCPHILVARPLWSDIFSLAATVCHSLSQRPYASGLIGTRLSSVTVWVQVRSRYIWT